MKCKDCPYCWKSEDESYARCHYERIADFDLAPCEYDDYEDEEEY